MSRILSHISYVFRLTNGNFYKQPNGGSWENKTISSKKLQTPNLEHAFHMMQSDNNVKANVKPYQHKCLEGGKWVAIKVTITYEEAE